MREFKGIYPAIGTPCGVAGGFGEAAMRRIVRYQLAAGVHGFYVCGGTGAAHRFPAISRPWTRTASLTGTAPCTVMAKGSRGFTSVACAIWRNTVSEPLGGHPRQTSSKLLQTRAMARH